MAAPKSTVWDLEPHTKAKHEILKRYLQAWVPIMGTSDFPQLMYIDGFAGPGRYSGGEPGSPIIAIETALEHQLRISGTVSFLFVEKDSKRAQTLQTILDDMALPPNFTVKVYPEVTFEQMMGGLFNGLQQQNRNLPPTFAFIDPFGWGGVSFNTVSHILGYRSCEVFVTFMYEEMNRFLGLADQKENFNSFFGTSSWKDIVSIPTPKERNRQLHDLYLNQLRYSAKAKYVRSFEMRNDHGLVDYYLFYATNNLLGLKKMKEAMWKVDSSGEFRFSDATDPLQSVFFIDKPEFGKLEDQMTQRFKGQMATIGDIEEFVVAETAFRETHYKGILKRMEYAQPAGLLLVDPPPSRKKGTYPNRLQRVRFPLR